MTHRPLVLVLAAAAACGAAAESNPSAAGLKALGPRVSELAALLEERRVVVDADSMESNLLEALVATIDPAGGEVLDPAQARQRQEEDLGRFYGIGCTVQLVDRRLQIAAVHSNSPAESAGLQVSNVIVRIDGLETEGLPLEEAVAQLRGGRDELLTLAIRPEPASEACRTVTVSRAAVQMPVTGTQETWPQGIGYLKVNGLYPDSGARIAEQLSLWRESNVFGVILDLRGAGGADLDSVAAVGSLFVPAGERLLTVHDGRGETVSVCEAGPARPLLAKPAMVLVDGDTRGAAEALAALLRGAPGCLLIGAPTRGDDRLREGVPLSETRVLYVATRRIELVRGPAYYGVGVVPHVTVSPSDEPEDDAVAGEEPDLFAENSERHRQDRILIQRVAGDPVLQRAADLLLGLKALDVKVR